MANQLVLDRAFHSLANPTRREVVSRLGEGRASVSELAEPFDMALPSFMKHLDVLEESGMVSSEKSGRVRIYRLDHLPLVSVETWLDDRRRQWETRLNQLDSFLESLKGTEK